jgi:hypothetical protein
LLPVFGFAFVSAVELQQLKEENKQLMADELMRGLHFQREENETTVTNC